MIIITILDDEDGHNDNTDDASDTDGGDGAHLAHEELQPPQRSPPSLLSSGTPARCWPPPRDGSQLKK